MSKLLVTCLHLRKVYIFTLQIQISLIVQVKEMFEISPLKLSFTDYEPMKGKQFDSELFTD